MRRRGAWIWRDRGVARPVSPLVGSIDPKLDANLFVLFRRSVTLDGPPARAPLRISADGRYQLFVNGALAGRGPARCDPLFQCYDVHDVAPLLRAGENVVAALVHTYGRNMSWYELPRTDWSRTFGCGGLFVECDAVPALDGGDGWRYKVSGAWERDTAAGSVGYAEVFDARRHDEAWTQPGYDDAAWERAVVLRAPGIGMGPAVEPFPQMVEREIPPLLEEPRDGVAVAAVREVAASGDMLAMAQAAGKPLSACAVEGVEWLLRGEGAARVRLAAGRAVSIAVDFGRTVPGHPRIEVEGTAGATVDVSYGERLREDGRVPVQLANPITSQNVHRYVLRDGAQAWEKFDRAGFRYLQLTVSAPDAVSGAEVIVRRAQVTFTSYPVGERGAFECSDGTLTRIWLAGRDTLQACMQDGFEDCPSREQRQWVGDAYVESLVNYACFGDGRLVAKLLRQVAQSQRRDGMTQMATPGDLAAASGLYIVDYCLLWVMTIGAHAWHTGDAAIVGELFPAVARAVAWFERHIGEDGLLYEPPGWIFIDWAEVDRRGASTALNALLIAALREAAAMATQAGDGGRAARWCALAEKAADAADRLLWDERRGVYVDALLADGPVRRVSQQSNAAMIAAGVAPPERWARMLDYVTDAARVVATSTGFGGAMALDEERQVVLAQPYFTHFVHRALAAAGRHEAIVENIRERWAPMLGAGGGGTFWEHWHGQESRCHAWSTTPVHDLSREVLGVSPAAPGYAAVRIEPHPCGLAWARGRYPTPRGEIEVSWRRDGGEFALDVTVPDGATAETVLPAGAADVRVDGRPGGSPAALGAGRHALVARLADA